jgi:hypothetical protein
VPPPSPVVVVEAPLEGQVFAPETWIDLRGAATLPGGGEEGLSYAWLLDDGLLEQGPSARAMLQEGQYALTLLAWDGDGFFGSQTLVLLVEENDPPNPPILPWPVDGGADQSIDAVLSWLGGDTDGDPVTYDVFLEAGNPNPAALLCDDTPLSECATALAPGTLYYWRVTARDDKGLEAESETWSFTTGELSLDEVIFADGFE